MHILITKTDTDYTPPDGDFFDAVRDALEDAEIPAVVSLTDPPIEELKRIFGEDGEHPIHTLTDWRADVAASLGTRLGYWEWVEAQVQIEFFAAQDERKGRIDP